LKPGFAGAQKAAGVHMKNKIFIRDAKAGDAGEIARVNVYGWRTAYAGIMPAEFLLGRSVESSRAGWEKNLAAKRGLVLVAEKDGGICGFASGGRAREGLPGFDSEIYAIYVDQAVRGLGAGAALMRAFFGRQAALGARNCALWVLEENPYRKFYEKMGGTLLSLKKTAEFGGKSLTEAAYAWNKLEL